MDTRQIERLIAIWTELAAVEGNVSIAQELFAFDPATAAPDDPTPYNIDGSLTEALGQVRYIREQLRDLAADAGITQIVDEFDADRIANEPTVNDESNPM
ncbi:hypothetical protein VQ042_17070 [Aurantimonas sp. A2-1-M11]|uniref:hypothetical protein n=1 Tax=Aurantimonas sp. A2-1-M11 TaxID=3113712 RepID=UPI002F931DC6